MSGNWQPRGARNLKEATQLLAALQEGLHGRRLLSSENLLALGMAAKVMAVDVWTTGQLDLNGAARLQPRLRYTLPETRLEAVTFQ